MKAIRLHSTSVPTGMVYEAAPQQHPKEGEVLVRVYAAAITPGEHLWSETWKTATGQERLRPIPGHEFSGVVVETGLGVTQFAVGDAVYGYTDARRDGAEAEYCLALPTELALKPSSLDHVQAAAVPLSALTAWQTFFDHAQLSAGQRVLIHGAAGGVGIFAVQIAHWIGAHVIGTASARLCWLLVASVGPNWPVRTPHAVSCSLPIPERKRTISSMHLLILTKGNGHCAEDSHLHHEVDAFLSSVAPPPLYHLDHTRSHLAAALDTDRPFQKQV